jgi:luciferase family oxidoreductase group 1
MIAGSAPEVLLGALGMATKEIRLGSGGIMLPHYSPYKVAEQFSVLANLYPDRVDLGVGRAPGADMSTAVALSPDGRPRFDRFEEQVAQLSRYLWKPDAKPVVSPKPPANLPIWMLGSSVDSAILAAKRGLPYNLGLFINPSASPEVIKVYRDRFVPSERCPEPYVILTLSVFCAEDKQRAEDQSYAFDVNFFRFVTGQEQNSFLPTEEALKLPMMPQFREFRMSRANGRVAGDPGFVASKLSEYVDRYQVDEVMAVSSVYSFEERLDSFRLLKDAVA